MLDPAPPPPRIRGSHPGTEYARAAVYLDSVYDNYLYGLLTWCFVFFMCSTLKFIKWKCLAINTHTLYIYIYIYIIECMYSVLFWVYQIATWSWFFITTMRTYVRNGNAFVNASDYEVGLELRGHICVGVCVCARVRV